MMSVFRLGPTNLVGFFHAEVSQQNMLPAAHTNLTLSLFLFQLKSTALYCDTSMSLLLR